MVIGEAAAALIGRILLSLMFFVTATTKILDWDGTSAYMASTGLPLVPFLLVTAIVVEYLGALSVSLGWKARWGAVALILFLLPATFIFHAFWTFEPDQQRGQLIHFLKNIAMMGGLFMVLAYGAGPFAMDNRRQASSGYRRYSLT